MSAHVSAMKSLLIVLSFFVMTSTSYADNHNKGVTALSPELQQLFTKEMVQLKQGMQEIMTAYISGEWETIVPIAKKMENSYVLRQNLSKAQMHELHSKLPDDFLALDDKFHYYSGMLSHVSEMKKVELIGFYYAKMSETCVSCHALYATHKFPSFHPTAQHKNHHH